MLSSLHKSILKSPHRQNLVILRDALYACPMQYCKYKVAYCGISLIRSIFPWPVTIYVKDARAINEHGGIATPSKIFSRHQLSHYAKEVSGSPIKYLCKGYVKRAKHEYAIAEDNRLQSGRGYGSAHLVRKIPSLGPLSCM